MARITEGMKIALHNLAVLTQHTLEDRPDVPPTRDELCLMKNTTKKDLKLLENVGLIKGETIIVKERVNQENTATRTVGRVCYRFTPIGEKFLQQIGIALPVAPPPKDPGVSAEQPTATEQAAPESVGVTE